MQGGDGLVKPARLRAGPLPVRVDDMFAGVPRHLSARNLEAYQEDPQTMRRSRGTLAGLPVV